VRSCAVERRTCQAEARLGSAWGGTASLKKKAFFFEKKKQKTFVTERNE
jgi:hypothetical protein